MKIAMINTSPRLLIRKNDTCPVNTALLDMRRLLRRHNIHDFEDFHVKTGSLPPDRIKALFSCDIWFIVFPVYSSGLPSHVFSFMQQIEESAAAGGHGEISVYGMGLTPLFDGREAYSALQSLSLWCQKCGFNWSGGMGTGGALTHIGQKIGRVAIGQKRTYTRRLVLFAEAVAEGHSWINVGCTPDQSRNAFVLTFNKLMRHEARANGLTNLNIREQP